MTRPARTILALAALAFAFSAPVSAEQGEWKPRYPDLPLHQDFGGPFTLTNHFGETFTEADLEGHLSLIYFGYTSCPDICALTLHTVSLALENLGDLADGVHPIFVNLDHMREDLPHLQEYVGFFHEDILGLTGTAAQLRAVSGAYGIRFKHVHGASEERETTHSGMIFLTNPDGDVVAMLPHDVPVHWLTATLREHLSPDGEG